jgi:hypothetical protein
MRHGAIRGHAFSDDVLRAGIGIHIEYTHITSYPEFPSSLSLVCWCRALLSPASVDNSVYNSQLQRIPFPFCYSRYVFA